MGEKGISVRKATLINASGKYLKVILTVLVNAVLARILSPFDFGIVAVITVFTTFFSTLSDMGLGPAIVQKKELSRNDIDSLFTYSLYVSLGLCVLFLLCAFPIAAFYRDRIYLKPSLLLTISLFFNALNMVPNGILNRHKKFATIAVRTVVVYSVSAAVSIVLALKGWRFYALVVQAILSSALQFGWNFLSTRPHILRHPDKTAISIVKTYSLYQFAFNIVNYFARNLDNLLTGKFMGEVNLGNYNKAYNLMLFPVNNLSGVVSPVLHPILSDYQNEPDAIYRRFVRLVRFLFCIGIFVASIAYLAADEIVGILYGSQWKPCVVCLKMLSIAIIPQMINASAGAIFQAIGNTKLLFISSCINTALTCAAILLGIFCGGTIESLSLCVAVSYVFHFICAFYLLICKGFGYKAADFAGKLFREWIMTALMVAAVLLYPFKVEGMLLSLLLKTAYAGGIFALMMLVSREYKLLDLN